MMHYRLLTLLLAFHILVAQLGVNIFMLYCCCTKKVEFSFIPKEDPCFKKHITKSCHTKGKNCSISHGLKKPCENQLVEYKALDFDAEKPSQEKLPDFTSCNFTLLSYPAESNIAVPISLLQIAEYIPYKTCGQRLVLYCVKLC